MLEIPFSLHNLNHDVQRAILDLTGWCMPNSRQFYELIHPRYNLEYIYFPVNPDSEVEGIVDMIVHHNNENCNKNMDEFISQVLDEEKNQENVYDAPEYQNNEYANPENDYEDNQSQYSDESYDPSDDMPSLVSDSEDYGIVHPSPSESKSQISQHNIKDGMKWKEFCYKFYKNSILVRHKNESKNKEFNQILDLNDYLDIKNENVRTTGYYNKKLNSWIFSKKTESYWKKLGVQK